jgi:hypothetical protein
MFTCAKILNSNITPALQAVFGQSIDNPEDMSSGLSMGKGMIFTKLYYIYIIYHTVLQYCEFGVPQRFWPIEYFPLSVHSLKFHSFELQKSHFLNLVFQLTIIE